MFCAFLEPKKSWETRYETNFPRFAGRNCSIVLRWTWNQKFCLFQNSCKTAPNQCQFSGFKQGKGPFKYYVSKEVPNADMSKKIRKKNSVEKNFPLRLQNFFSKLFLLGTFFLVFFKVYIHIFMGGWVTIAGLVLICSKIVCICKQFKWGFFCHKNHH